MSGPPPKDPEQRRRVNPPARGEWTEIPRQVPHRVPPLPRRKGAWSAYAKDAWRAWWSDPASVMWDHADKAAVRALLEATDEWYVTRKIALLSEQRQRCDQLGLSQKGKRDLRWRVVDEPSESVEDRPVPAGSRREQLRVVAG